MIAELISVALLMLVFVNTLCCVINCMMYLAMMTACRRNHFPVQGPEMEGPEGDRRRDVLRNRRDNSQRTGNRARPQEHDE